MTFSTGWVGATALAGAVAFAPAAAPAQGAVGAPSAAVEPATTADELRALRGQLQALAERLEKLERANAELQSANAQLQQQTEKVEAVEQSVERLQAGAAASDDALAKARAPEWAGRFQFRGDVRYRHERTESGDDRAVPGSPPAQFPVVNSLDRVRDRVRFRFGGTFRVNDTVTAGLRLGTGGENPRSGNQTFTDQSSRKSFGLEQAFVAWQPDANWQVRVGKIPQPWVRPGSSLFFDSDINPEGAAVNYARGRVYGSASYLVLQERGPTQVVAGQGLADVSDPAMAHVQLGLRHPFASGASLTVGTGYFDHFAVQGRRPFFGGNPLGNTTRNVNFPVGASAGTPALPTLVAVAAYDYDIVQLYAQYDRVLFAAMPFQLHVEYGRNVDAELDTAWGAGFTLGRAAAPGKWEFGALYQRIEKDALFAQWIDSNFGAGNTDAQGWVLRGAYAPVRNVTFNATLTLSELNVDVYSPTAPRDRSYERLQLDANFRF